MGAKWWIVIILSFTMGTVFLALGFWISEQGPSVSYQTPIWGYELKTDTGFLANVLVTVFGLFIGLGMIIWFIEGPVLTRTSYQNQVRREKAGSIIESARNAFDDQRREIVLELCHNSNLTEARFTFLPEEAHSGSDWVPNLYLPYGHTRLVRRLKTLLLRFVVHVDIGATFMLHQGNTSLATVIRDSGHGIAWNVPWYTEEILKVANTFRIRDRISIGGLGIEHLQERVAKFESIVNEARNQWSSDPDVEAYLKQSGFPKDIARVEEIVRIAGLALSQVGEIKYEYGTDYDFSKMAFFQLARLGGAAMQFSHRVKKVRL